MLSYRASIDLRLLRLPVVTADDAAAAAAADAADAADAAETPAKVDAGEAALLLLLLLLLLLPPPINNSGEAEVEGGVTAPLVAAGGG